MLLKVDTIVTKEKKAFFFLLYLNEQFFYVFLASLVQ